MKKCRLQTTKGWRLPYRTEGSHEGGFLREKLGRIITDRLRRNRIYLLPFTRDNHALEHQRSLYNLWKPLRREASSTPAFLLFFFLIYSPRTSTPSPGFHVTATLQHGSGQLSPSFRFMQLPSGPVKTR